MVKCLCKENVQDKFTGENYVAGKEYKFTKERAEEVTNTKYFELVKEEPKEEPKAEVETKPKRVKKSTK
jgi:hypothetical protein